MLHYDVSVSQHTQQVEAAGQAARQFLHDYKVASELKTVV